MLTTDAEIYRYLERYLNEDLGGNFWDKVTDLLLESQIS